jgi:2-oxoglutarate ferredoxin oxidoreductase subunit alpha
MPLPKILGNPKAKKTVVIWGSTKGPIKDAYHSLPDSKQKQIKIMQLQYIWPFPAEFVRNILGSSKKVLLIENNSNAQLGQLIAQETGIKIDNQLLKYNGRPFFTEEILSALNDF